MRRTLLGLYALALACGPGSSAGTDGATTGASSGSSGTGDTGSSTTDIEPTGPGTTTAGTTTGTTGDSGGSSQCAIVNDGDYGECDAALGWAFDGTHCRVVSGCECAPDCDIFFPDAASCALGCAAAGECNHERMQGKYLGKTPVEIGDLCDGVEVCFAGPEDPSTAVAAIWGAGTCQWQSNLCETDWSCPSPIHGTLDADMFAQMCAVTMLAGLDTIFCVVLGP